MNAEKTCVWRRIKENPEDKKKLTFNFQRKNWINPISDDAVWEASTRETDQTSTMKKYYKIYYLTDNHSWWRPSEKKLRTELDELKTHLRKFQDAKRDVRRKPANKDALRKIRKLKEIIFNLSSNNNE